jgi:hypothetical protein
VREQHGEIDRVNDDYARRGVDFRVLKGIECDILADGALDYDERTLALFDYVIGSVHSRFNLGEAEMTAASAARWPTRSSPCSATPTGRLLLQRDAYAVDVPAVLEAAAEYGARSRSTPTPCGWNLDWPARAPGRRLGLTVEIAPTRTRPPRWRRGARVGAARKGGRGAGGRAQRAAGGRRAGVRARQARGGPGPPRVPNAAPRAPRAPAARAKRDRPRSRAWSGTASARRTPTRTASWRSAARSSSCAPRS